MVILVIAFNRPKKLEVLLESIFSFNLGVEVLVSIDGPRNENDVIKISQVFEVIKKFPVGKIFESNKNLGLSAHITKAIDECFNITEELIILEDDCKPSLSFFNYAIRALEIFKNRKDIKYISGSNLNVGFDNGSDIFLSKYGQIWGWATWKDRWRERVIDVNFFKIIFSNKLNLDEKIFWLRNLRKPLWDSIWGFYNLFYHDGYALMPKYNLVENFGFDDTGSNYNQNSQRNIDYSITEHEISFTELPKYSRDFDLKLFNSRYKILL